MPARDYAKHNLDDFAGAISDQNKAVRLEPLHA